MTTPRSTSDAVAVRRPKRPLGAELFTALEPRILMSAWYVAPYGSDSNPGSLQQPFATIQQAANSAQAGDSVLIRGGSYHETVVPSSGTVDAPITFQPYNNEPVTIDGADPVAGWSAYQGHIYSAAQAWDLGEGSNQVFVDGKMAIEARYPNTNANVATPVWSKATSVSVSIANDGGLSTATLNSASLTQPAGALVGALVHIATGQEWVAQVGTVTASSPGSVTVSYRQETSYQVPKAGNRFYIAGAFQALDSANEWYRDPTTGLLYLWDSAGDSPALHNVEAKARDYAFDLSGLSNVTVQGISLIACTVNTDASSSNILLDRLKASYVSHSTGLASDNQDPWSAQYHPHTTGIILNGTGNVLQNSTVNYSSGDGVFLGGSGNTVQNCAISNTDYEGGDEAGITTLGSNESVLYNTVYNTGRSGIVIRFTTASQILHNVVHNVGMQMTDLGAIYTWGTDALGTEIGYNICYNAHGGGFGTAGIYLDNGSQDYVVDHNLVYSADFALKMNPPCWNDLIVNNTLVASAYSLQTSGNRDMTGSTLINNIFTRSAMIGPGATASNNLFSSTIPLFVDASKYNFHLQATSPAVDAGLGLSPYTDNSVDAGVDIGAYEYGLTPWTAGQGAVVTPAAVLASAATDYFSPQRYSSRWAVTASGDGIRFWQQGNWAGFKSIDFGGGVTQFIAQISSLPSKTERLQIRIDRSSGPAVGTLTIPAAAQPSSSVAQTFTATLKGLSGIHDLYIVMIDIPTGGVLDGFTFTP